MGVLQDIFDQELGEQLVDQAVTKEALRRALARREIILNESKLEELARRVLTISDDATSIRVDHETAADYAVSLSDLEAGLQSYEQEIVAWIRENVTRNLKAMPPLVLSALHDRSESELAATRERRAEFKERLLDSWREGISRLEMLTLIARELGDSVLCTCKKDPARSDLQSRRASMSALISLHARACRIAEEVLTLLREGFADGASARWRALHETAVTAVFIAQEGEPVAERYLAHAAIEEFKSARQYQEHCRSLGYEPIPPGEIAVVNKHQELTHLQA